MEKPFIESGSDFRPDGIDESELMEDISKRIDTAFNVAIGKFVDSNGDLETVMQTGEAFGRGLFEDYIKEKPTEWTMEDWINSMEEHIFNPLGNSFTFSNISEDKVESVLTRCPLQENTDESQVASLFTYGFMRGLLLSAFPNGELIMGDTIEEESSKMTEFVFKTSALYRDRFERERIKSSFSITKKL